MNYIRLHLALVVLLFGVIGCRDASSSNNDGSTLSSTTGQQANTPHIVEREQIASNKLPYVPASEPPVDTRALRASELASTLRQSASADIDQLEVEFKSLGDIAIEPLVATLVDGDHCHPTVLKMLYRLVGMPAHGEPKSFVEAVQEETHAGTKRLNLSAIFNATESSNPSARVGAFRYLRQLGYVGAERVALADACWNALQFDQDRAVVIEASRLRRQQTATAITMIDKNHLSFQMPLLPKTAEWLAHLGSDAVRTGRREPLAKAKIASSRLMMHNYELDSDLVAAADRRRAYFERIRADAVQAAKERGRGQTRRGYTSSPVLVSALGEYLAQRTEGAAKLEEEAIKKLAARTRDSREDSLKDAILALEVLDTVLDARLLDAANRESPVQIEDLTLRSAIDSPLHKLALQKSSEHANRGEHYAAIFWAGEAAAGYLNWPSGVHRGFLEAMLKKAESESQLGELQSALANIRFATDSLVVRGDYKNVNAQGIDARQLRARMDKLRADILDQLGHTEQAAFYRDEERRFAEPAPDDDAIAKAVRLAEQADAEYENENYAVAIDQMLAARRTLDPPIRDTLSKLLTLHLRLGHALRETGRPATSLCIALHGLAVMHVEAGRDSAANAPMILMLAAAQRDLGELEDAEQTIELSRRTFQEGRRVNVLPDPMLLASCDHHLGLLRVKQGRIDDGRRLLEQAYAARRKSFGDDHRLTRQTAMALKGLSQGISDQ